MIERSDLPKSFEIIENPIKYGYIECWDCQGEGCREKTGDINLYEMCDTCGGDGVMKDSRINIEDDEVQVIYDESGFTSGAGVV